MSTIKLPAASGGGSISIKGPASSGSDVDLLDTSGNLTVSGDIDLADNKKIKLGDGNDLEIYHSGSHSHIKDSGTGHLQIDGSRVQLRNVANDDPMVDCTGGGTVEIFHNGSKKLETTSEGVLGRGCAHAYGRIDGQSTPSIERDFGCGSITDVSAGRYNVGLTNALADNEHMIGFINCHPINTGSQIFGFGEIYQNSTTLIELHMRRCDNDAPSVSTDDWDNIAFVIFDVS